MCYNCKVFKGIALLKKNIINGFAVYYKNADVAKLADAQVSGSCGQPYGFKSLHPHQRENAPFIGAFFVGMINEFMKGFEGGSRFAGAKRCALRRF